jgi:hypothetical protein
MPCSIVLLLRQFHYFTNDELMEAGSRGFGKSFDGVEDPMFFVVQKGPITLLKAGRYGMNVLHRRGAYLDDDKAEIAEGFVFKRQKNAWLAHSAWASVDMLNRETPNAEAYAVLSRFALQMADQNCSAVFLPKHNILLTNDGQAEEWLHGMIRGDKDVVNQVR